MTGDYSIFKNKYIHGYNNGSDTVRDSLEECKIACISNPSCLSFETYHVGDELKCTTGLVTYEMIISSDPTQFKHDETYNLYSKTCS
jgi:hypothetical protein